jgi:hypothetical protein
VGADELGLLEHALRRCCKGGERELEGVVLRLARAVESGRPRHLALAGAMVGLALMTKMLQGWMVLPVWEAVGDPA